MNRNICEESKPFKVIVCHFLTYKLVSDLQVSFASVADKAAPRRIASAKRTRLTLRVQCGAGEKVRLPDIAFRQRMNFTVGMIDNGPTTAKAPSFA
jgi:hypothetical protein